ncbi:hypothetical protein EJD97_022044, partial [Solanum chilense]
TPSSSSRETSSWTTMRGARSEDHHRTSIAGSNFSSRVTRRSLSTTAASRRWRYQLSPSPAKNNNKLHAASSESEHRQQPGYCKNGSSFRFLHGGGPWEGKNNLL